MESCQPSWRNMCKDTYFFRINRHTAPCFFPPSAYFLFSRSPCVHPSATVRGNPCDETTSSACGHPSATVRGNPCDETTSSVCGQQFNYVGFRHGFLVAFYAISCRRKNLFALKGRVWETHRVDKPRMLLRSALGLCTFAPSRCGFMHTLPTSVHKHCSAQLHKLLRQSIGQCIRLKLQYRTVADGCGRLQTPL